MFTEKPVIISNGLVFTVVTGYVKVNTVICLLKPDFDLELSYDHTQELILA